jgi:hypothetical protein
MNGYGLGFARLANAFMRLCLRPRRLDHGRTPMTLFCINKTSPSAARVGVFCINTLAFSREGARGSAFSPA